MDETNGRGETHDFMNVNVESFSQLPFIRRTPPAKEKSSIIRLFGQELVGDNSSGSTLQQEQQEDLSVDSSEIITTTKNEEISENVKDKEKDKDNNNNNRRFECHYCFRNFPTSQALGGHQNAHKRERQHAKRGSMTSYLHHPDAHHNVYGFVNNHHRHYPTWTSEARFYGGGLGGGQHQTSSYYSRTLPPPTPPHHHHHHPSNSPTITGSPLGLWRVPPSTSSNAIQSVYSSASTFRSHEQETKEPNRPYRLMKPPNVQDHVSLDLHL